MDVNPCLSGFRTCLRQHRSRLIESDNLDSTLRDGDRKPTRSTCQLEHGTCRTFRLLYIERKIRKIQDAVQRVIVACLAIERDGFGLWHLQSSVWKKETRQAASLR